jgi:hypothetical protein
MIKRLSGEVVNARTYWRRCRLLLLKVLTHNISILRQRLGFLLSMSHIKTAKVASFARRERAAVRRSPSRA